VSETIFACKVEDLPVGGRATVQTDEDVIAVFNVDGVLFAVSNICPHAGGALSGGFVEKGRVSCPWHGWSFPLDCEEPIRDGLWRYRVEVKDDEIHVELPAVNR
jgi:nitrite reductase/ring-hydroxylating ferredoxin subunit